MMSRPPLIGDGLFRIIISIVSKSKIPIWATYLNLKDNIWNDEKKFGLNNNFEKMLSYLPGILKM